MKTSEAINELSAALAKAQGEFPAIERGRTATVRTKAGGSYKYNYADLADVIAAVGPALSKHGLNYSHDCVVTREPLGVETTFTLRHSTGQFAESAPLWLPCDDFMAATQAIGSACTYGKRYTLQNGLGIATEEDDDGNAASGNDAETSRKDLPPKPVCPNCSVNLYVIKGKEEYGGGWLCYKAKGGCGAKWPDDAEPPKEDAAKKAKQLADEVGVLTAAQLEYVADCTRQIMEAATVETLDTIAAFIKDKDETVRKKLGPIWLKKMKVINPNWTKKEKATAA